MHARGNQQMSIVVGKTVQDNQRMRSPFDNQVFAVLRACQASTQEAAPSTLNRFGRLVDVLRTPWSPNLLQTPLHSIAHAIDPKLLIEYASRSPPRSKL